MPLTLVRPELLPVVTANLHDDNEAYIRLVLRQSMCVPFLPQICIIPTSAHGTNPASAIMAGMKIVTISTDSKGNINIPELKEKAEQHKDSCALLWTLSPAAAADVHRISCQPPAQHVCRCLLSKRHVGSGLPAFIASNTLHPSTNSLVRSAETSGNAPDMSDAGWRR